MSNINNNLQTQTSNALHNAIMEAGGKDRPPMLAPANYVQWKSRIKRYINTKPNHELIYYCHENLPYEYKWIPNPTPDTPATPSTDGGIDNNIYSTVDACPNSKEMWKAIERLKHGKEIANSPLPTYDPEPEAVADDEASLKEKEIDKLMALILMSFNKIYKPTNNNLKTSSNTRNTKVDNTLRTNQETRYDRQTRQYDNQRAVNVAGARENVGTQEKMLPCKQEEAEIQLSEEQAVWRDDSDDKPEDQEPEEHYMYMEKVQEVITEATDNSGPIFDTEPLEKVHTADDHYNVFANERQHPEQLESIDNTYGMEQDERNTSPDSSNMCSDEGEADQDNDLEKERVLLASSIEKLKSEIDENKKQNKSLDTSNKAFQEANKELGAVNTTLTKDLDKFEIELDRYKYMKCVKDATNDCAKAYGLLAQQKVNSKKSFNDYTLKINQLNLKLSQMEKELSAHQKSIFTISYEKEEQDKFYKTREEKEIEKVICLENQVKALNDIVYKTGQSVQTMIMLNRSCKMSFAKP
ncbi:hypothetical protein Tco_0205554 [Tanacetum coccineum]